MSKQQEVIKMDIITDELAEANSIRPNKYNPNRQSDDEFLLLIKSIVADGFTDAVLINKATREIIDGEHRWTAAIVLNHLIKNNLPVNLTTTALYRKQRDEIMTPDLKLPVKVLDKDEIQRRISTQRHNKARGQDDIELASQMMRELEKLGGIEAAVAGLDMSSEEVERLLSYGDSILDHFPGDKPSLAWEPRQTQPGQVKSFVDAENSQSQSVSKAAATPTNTQGDSLTPVVPGMAQPIQEQPRMARRIFILLEEEAHIVDKALGTDGASELVKLCKEKLKGEKK